jgi:hypothetical protein
MRDVTDTHIHPRIPDRTGIVTVKSHALILLVLTVGGIIPGLPASSGLL